MISNIPSFVELIPPQKSGNLQLPLTTIVWHSYFNTSLNQFLNLNLTTMLRWSVIFLIVAIVAAVFGFGGIAAGAAGIAKILFFVFLVLFVISLLTGRTRNV